MAARALNFKMDESDITEIREVASVFNMTVTDVFREAVKEYLAKMRQDPLYRLTANVKEASAEESAEILQAIGRLTEDDLSIAPVRQ